MSPPAQSRKWTFLESMMERADGTASVISASKARPWRFRSRRLRTCA
jgi:hypothetical protein